MAQRFNFQGSAAAVTGAASGIGRANCVLFASEGARVVVVDLPGTAIHRTDGPRQSTVLVRVGQVQLAAQSQAGWQADPVSFEQLVLAYLQRPSGATTTGNPAQAATRPGPGSKAVSR